MIRGKPKLPNIILIVLDTVGAKHMSLYGYPRQTTPHLERIAGECTLYNRCYAPGCWTIPSHASMFTGLYPSQHGCHEANIFLSDNYQHMVPVLKMAGYRTFGIVSNGLVSPEAGLCRDFDKLKLFGTGGFAHFQDKFARSDDTLLARLSKILGTRERLKVAIRYFIETRNYRQGFQDVIQVIKYKAKRFYKPSPFQKSSKYTLATARLFKETIKKYYKSNGGEPYFFFINFLEAHEIYRPPLKSRRFSHFYDKQFRLVRTLYKDSIKNNSANSVNIDLHDDEIYFLDYTVRRLWEIIRKLPDYDNTMVIITSDHGEQFGEKGLYGHNLSLYNELIWVPLLVKFPGGLGPKGPINNLVSLNDMYNTILDLTNSPLPRPESSHSLFSSSPREMILSQIMHYGLWQALMKEKAEQDSTYSPARMAIVTDKNNKIIEKDNGELELFDLNNDRDEDHNLIETVSPEAKENLQRLIEFLKEDTGFNKAVKEIETVLFAENPNLIIDY